LCIVAVGCRRGNVENVPASNPTTRDLPTTTQSRDDAAVEGASAKLQSPDIEIRIAGARELGERGDERAVPALLGELKSYASPYRGVGGSEQSVPVRIYRKELVTSLSKLTGLIFDFPGEPERFTGAPPRSYDQVGRLNRVIDETERWLTEREEKRK